MSQTISQSRIRFDRDSRELAATYDTASTPQFLHGQKLIELLGLKPGEQVLDVGAGTGRLAEHVVALVGPEGAVTGIDPLSLRIEQARERSRPNLKFRLGRAEDLSQFADHSFDAVYLNSVFHWIDEKPAALAEAFRVLKPGGRIAVNSADPERAHQSAQLLRDILNERRWSEWNGWDSGANAGVSASSLQNLMAAAGFSGVETERRAFTDYHESAAALINWRNSSSFGNFLNYTSEIERDEIIEAFSRRLELFRTPQGLRLERYLVFAVGYKKANEWKSGQLRP